LRAFSGGTFGVQEALHHGVPMLFIPFLSDHSKNAAFAEKQGYGSVLQFDDLTRETLVDKINEMTTNPTFKQQATAVSTLFRDNPIKPMDSAIYWIEYAIRNKGAKHLKSSSVNFCWIKYNMLDVGLFFVALFIGIILFWVLVIKLCVKRYRAKEHKGKFKYY
jgi:glucuronosyltransferase